VESQKICLLKLQGEAKFREIIQCSVDGYLIISSRSTKLCSRHDSRRRVSYELCIRLG